jgi:hypothetical protein
LEEKANIQTLNQFIINWEIQSFSAQSSNFLPLKINKRQENEAKEIPTSLKGF